LLSSGCSVEEVYLVENYRDNIREDVTTISW
jgi:hypothetical protein